MRERGFFVNENMSSRRKDVVKTITQVKYFHVTKVMSLLLHLHTSFLYRYARTGWGKFFWQSLCTPQKTPANIFNCEFTDHIALTRIYQMPISTLSSCECHLSIISFLLFLAILTLFVHCVAIYRERGALSWAVQALWNHATRATRSPRKPQVHH